MTNFSTISVDVELPLRQYLTDNIAGMVDETDTTFRTVIVKEFAPETPNRAILVRRDGSFGQEMYSPIDRARVLVVCRDETPDDVLALSFEVRNLLNRLSGVDMSGLHVGGMYLDAGIDWIDDGDTSLYKTYQYYNMIVREE